MNTQRIPNIELSAATEITKCSFETLTAGIGKVPNMARAMAQSPDAPKDYLALLEALSKGFLDKKLAAEIALSLAGLHFNPNHRVLFRRRTATDTISLANGQPEQDPYDPELSQG